MQRKHLCLVYSFLFLSCPLIILTKKTLEIRNMPITFLTWNIHQKDCLQPLKEILNDFQVDILLLNESLLDDLQIYQETGLKRIISLHKKCKFYSKLPDATFYLHNDNVSNHILCCCLKTQNDIILIAGVHLPSKLWRDEDTQATMSIDHIEDINLQQKQLKLTQVIVFGDFNMNPFDKGMIDAKGFNSVSDKTTAKITRKLNAREYERFYNPTFSLLGDFIPTTRVQKVAGTYYLDNLKSVNEYHWNMLDNVLLKGNIIDTLDLPTIQIIQQTKSYNLVNLNNNSFTFSDHLPLLFKLNTQ